jgi:hypothetical protein
LRKMIIFFRPIVVARASFDCEYCFCHIKSLHKS